MVRRFTRPHTAPERWLACLVVGGISWLITLGLVALGLYCLALPWLAENAQVTVSDSLPAGFTCLGLSVGMFFLWRRVIRPGLFG